MAPTARLFAPARTLLLIALFAAVLAPQAALAQTRAPTPAELRRENDALRERVAQLEAELNSATETIESLREQMDALGDQLESLRRELRQRPADTSGDDAPAEPATPEPTFAEVPTGEPLSSPEAMYQALRESYDAELSGMPRETDPEFRRFISELSQWSRMMRREIRGQAEWVIEITGVVVDDEDELVVSYRVIDPESRLPYSDREHQLELPRGIAERRFRDNPDHELWLVRGRAFASPQVNRDREEVGFFDIPRFIGPFAEFGFQLDLETFVRVADPEEIAEIMREREEREREQREQNDGSDEEVGPTGSGANRGK